MAEIIELAMGKWYFSIISHSHFLLKNKSFVKSSQKRVNILVHISQNDKTSPNTTDVVLKLIKIMYNLFIT